MRNDPDCIFCKIISKEIPARILFESDESIAFLDINPLAEGHLLVVPRTHFQGIVEMPGDLLGQLASLLPALGRALVSVTGADGFNILQNNGAAAGQVVSHVHFHLIPRVADDGLGYRWNAGNYPQGRDVEVAEAFRAAMTVAG